MKLSKSLKRKICEDVINHWTENLLLAHANLLNCIDVQAKRCAFCSQFLCCGCYGCPMSNINNRCGEDNAAWLSLKDLLLDKERHCPRCPSYQFEDGTTNNVELVTATEKVLRVVEQACDYLLYIDN